MQEQRITLGRLVVGAAAARNVAAVVIDLPPDLTYQGRYGRIDGILGYTFLKHFVVTIDYERSRATFAPSSVNGSHRVPMVLVHSAPAVHGTVAGVHALFMLDSGNNGISIASGRFVQRAGGFTQGACASAEQTHEGVGGFASTPLVRVREIHVGDSIIHNVVLAITTAPEQALADSVMPTFRGQSAVDGYSTVFVRPNACER